MSTLKNRRRKATQDSPFAPVARPGGVTLSVDRCGLWASLCDASCDTLGREASRCTWRFATRSSWTIRIRRLGRPKGRARPTLACDLQHMMREGALKTTAIPGPGGALGQDCGVMIGHTPTGMARSHQTRKPLYRFRSQSTICHLNAAIPHIMPEKRRPILRTGEGRHVNCGQGGKARTDTCYPDVISGRKASYGTRDATVRRCRQPQKLSGAPVPRIHDVMPKIRTPWRMACRKQAPRGKGLDQKSHPNAVLLGAYLGHLVAREGQGQAVEGSPVARQSG